MRDGVNLTLLDGIMRISAFDKRAVESIDIQASLGISTRDRDSTPTYLASRITTSQALSQCHHITQNLVAQLAGNEHQHWDLQHYARHCDALQQPAPRITIPFTPVTLHTC
ncbi:hypothetical protein BDR03DRAFT_438786 [Suillus americanus]|nr:hypothetical protein BDR03DRAFT_438786 [Suillus americanus]